VEMLGFRSFGVPRCTLDRGWEKGGVLKPDRAALFRVVVAPIYQSQSVLVSVRLALLLLGCERLAPVVEEFSIISSFHATLQINSMDHFARISSRRLSSTL